MAHSPYLPKQTVSDLYSTSQSLSGIAPTYPAYSTHYTPSYTYTIEKPEPEASESAAPKKEESKTQPVDPVIFDILVTNETNLRLKKNFGIAFIVITCLFTLISYGIIVCASIWEWKIPSAALTALVVQAPLQMVGILYIMAKSLFPISELPKKK